LPDEILADVAGEFVPTVPTHGGRARKSIVEGGQLTGCHEAGCDCEGQAGERFCLHEFWFSTLRTLDEFGKLKFAAAR
jgi:hypothetical protein